MKKILACLLLALPLAVNQPRLAASESSQAATEPTFYKITWSEYTGVKNLYANLEVAPGIEFPKTYNTTLLNNGCSCEIVCKPEKGKKFETKDGVLEEFKLTVQLTNTSESDKVNYLVLQEFKVKKEKFFTSETKTIVNHVSGCLFTTGIDANERPQFATYSDSKINACMIFKKI